jgi:hypothetical protein
MRNVTIEVTLPADELGKFLNELPNDFVLGVRRLEPIKKRAMAYARSPDIRRSPSGRARKGEMTVAVTSILKEGELKAKVLAKKLGLKYQPVYATLWRMKRDGIADLTKDGTWKLAQA